MDKGEKGRGEDRIQSKKDVGREGEEVSPPWIKGKRGEIAPFFTVPTFS
jgi:hypothetical protein